VRRHFADIALRRLAERAKIDPAGSARRIDILEGQVSGCDEPPK